MTKTLLHSKSLFTYTKARKGSQQELLQETGTHLTLQKRQSDKQRIEQRNNYEQCKNRMQVDKENNKLRGGRKKCCDLIL